jgi:membrane protease YdiL (CAAX protease family)
MALVYPGVSGVSSILMPFAPAIACFVVRKWITREGFGDAGLGLNLRHWRLYLLAILWPLATSLLCVPLALVLHVAPVGFTLPWGVAAPSPASLLTMLAVSLALAPIVFGEEFGWRGYLQVRLVAGRPLLAAVTTGIIWGVWHYPLILTGGEPAQNRLITLLFIPATTVVFSIFLGWLRFLTGCVWTGSVAHASNNVTEDSLHSLSFTGHQSGIPSEGAGVASMLAEALVLLGVVLADHFRRQGCEMAPTRAVSMPSRDAAA